MRRHSESLLLSDAPRSPVLGALVAVATVAATTLVIYPLGAVAPAVSLGVVYLLAVLLTSTFWGLWLGLATAVMSAATFNWFHIPPTGRFHVADSQNWVALGVFLAAAAMASTVAEVARARAAEEQRRREEADLAAAIARSLLGGARLEEALVFASGHLAVALELPWAAIEPRAVPAGAGQVAIVLRGPATLLVPDDLELGAMQRLRERVVPPLEALLAATLDRERLQREVVETQALRRSDELKTALLRTVSHDLRSPLTAIITAGEAVRSPTLEPGQRRELASMIVGEAGRLSRLVEQLLDLSRLQAGTAEPRRDWCSVEEIVTSAAEHVGGIPIELDMQPDLPFLQADAAQLERVFVNVLENARRFSGGRPVVVRARKLDGRIEVRVVDRGPGIAPGELPRIFEPFHRRGANAGSGLGLAIVKGLVEANGGRVHAESSPGHGAAFCVELPLSRRSLSAGAL